MNRRSWSQGDIAHVVVMPNITIALLEEFMNNLIASRSQACTVHSPWSLATPQHASAQLVTSVFNLWLCTVLTGLPSL